MRRITRAAQTALHFSTPLKADWGPLTQLRRHEHASELIPEGQLGRSLALPNVGLKAGPGGRSSISGITATVFGCTGFLGRYIINALASQGSQVVLPYRCDDLDCQHLRQMGDLGQIVTLKDFDVRDDEAIRRAVYRSNVVINLLGADRETWNFNFKDVHVNLAQKVAQACAEAPAVEHFIHLSCLSASSTAVSRRLQTKAEGEEVVRAAFPDVTILKPSMMVGTEDRSYNTYAQLIKSMPFFPLVGGGKARYQPVYVRDVANAAVRTLTSRHCLGKTYHLAGPETLTERQLVALMYETLREQRRMVSCPQWLAELAAQPRERLLHTVPLPINTYFTLDAIKERQQDHVKPDNVLGFEELGIKPQKVLSGLPLEHIRYMRRGGYELGTLSSPQDS